MRFLESERNDLLKAIAESGRKENEFLFRKKRGILHVDDSKREINPYTYFREKKTFINDKQQFEDIVQYFPAHPTSKYDPMTWQEVLSGFENWLKL